MDRSFKSEEERKREEEIKRRVRYNSTHRHVYNPVNVSTVHDWVSILALSCLRYVRMRAEFDGHPQKSTIWMNLTIMVKERHINTLEGFIEFMDGECPTIEELAKDRGYGNALKRYLITDVKCYKSPNERGTGYASAVTSLGYVCDNVSRWFCISEFLGEPEYYVTEEDLFDVLSKGSPKEVGMLNLQPLEIFDGIALGDYHATLDNVERNPGNAAGNLLAYAIALTICRREDEGHFISLGLSKYSDEIPIFGSDSEEDDYFGDSDEGVA